MDFYPQFLPKFTASFHGCDRLPAAEVLDRNSQAPPPYCSICLSDVSGGDRYRKLAECGHCFHAECIDAWFKAHSTCPLCRTQMIWVNHDQDHRHYTVGDLISNVVALFRSFVEKLSSPLNDELAAMLSDNVRCISS